MDPWIQSIITITASVIASSGFWAWIQRRSDRKGAHTKLLLSIARDQIITRGMSYIDRGWVTNDEYSDFIIYLYNPYAKFGGNGLAEKIFEDVSKLPMRKHVKPVHKVQLHEEK